MEYTARINAVAPSITLQMTARANALKKEGYDVIGFGAGEPDFDTPDFIKQAAIKAIQQGFTKYTPSHGTIELRKAICNKFQSENGITYNPEQIMVSPGAKFALYAIFQTFLNPNDEILIPSPYWVSYPEMARLCEAKPVIIATQQQEDFKVNASILKKALTKKTKLFVLNSPSNPTGTVYTKEEIRSLAQVCVEHNIILVSDEIYEHLVYDGMQHCSPASLSKDIYAHTLVVNGVSKAFSMTGWRIGYVAGPEGMIEKMKLLQDHTTSNPCSISQMATLAALTEKSDFISMMRTEFQARRDLMVQELEKSDRIYCVKPKGAFYVFCDISKTNMTGVDFAKKLLEKKYVALVPGDGFGFPNHVRLSFATSRKNIMEGIRRMREFIDGI